MTHRASPSGAPRLATRIVALLALAAAHPALGAEPAAPKPAGFVDGSAFSSLAGDDADLVEIHLGAPLLRALAHLDGEDQGLGEAVRQLTSISAYIVGLKRDAARTEKATQMVREMEAKLERQAWQRLAVVREKETRVNVDVRSTDDKIDGLVVLVVDPDESQVVFANIAGTIDLARLGQLGQTFKVPGLEGLKPADKP